MVERQCQRSESHVLHHTLGVANWLISTSTSMSHSNLIFHVVFLFSYDLSHPFFSSLHELSNILPRYLEIFISTFAIYLNLQEIALSKYWQLSSTIFCTSNVSESTFTIYLNFQENELSKYWELSFNYFFCTSKVLESTFNHIMNLHINNCLSAFKFEETGISIYIYKKLC
jgi:hypothetical protein